MTIREVLISNKEDILSRLKSGESTSKIAKHYNCNPGNVWYFLKSVGEKPNKSRTKNYGNSELYKGEILSLFRNGMSCYKISQQLSIPKKTIIRWINQWGYDTSEKRKDNPNNLLKNKKNTVISMFESGMSCYAIGKNLGHNEVSVMQLLNKHGYSTSDWKIKVDESFFEKIDTEEKAYILGWIYSDGNVRSDGKLRICLNEKDAKILYKIKDIIKYEGELYNKPARGSSKSQVELCINRKKITNDLARLGVMPAKSLIIKFPTKEQVPQDLVRHFVRGVFDGDGSINKSGVMICGSYDFIFGLKELLPCTVTNIYQRYRDRNPEDSAHQLFIGRSIEINKFFEWIYVDATIYLERKRFAFGWPRLFL